MQFTISTLKTVQKLSLEQWTLHTLDKRHFGDGSGNGVMVLAC